MGTRPKRAFTRKGLADLRSKLKTIRPKADDLIVAYVSHQFSVARAAEYAREGFSRRVQTLRRCIENVFKIVPPGVIKAPSKERLQDAQINIQSAVANVYGCVDNLAWVWVLERRLSDKIAPKQVGLRKHNTRVRASLPGEFLTYLDGLEDWFEYVVDYRDALAHRIPLYIPSRQVAPRNAEAYNELTRRMNAAALHEYERLSVEQDKLLFFHPMIGHSFIEMKAPYYFHPQLIADFLTIEELGRKMLAELRRAE